MLARTAQDWPGIHMLQFIGSCCGKVGGLKAEFLNKRCTGREQESSGTSL